MLLTSYALPCGEAVFVPISKGSVFLFLHLFLLLHINANSFKFFKNVICMLGGTTIFINHGFDYTFMTSFQLNRGVQRMNITVPGSCIYQSSNNVLE